MASTLEQRFGTGRNNFDLLRLLFAAMVVVEHAVILQGRAGDFWGRSGTSGEIGVDGFFVLSGFLVTRSYLRLHSLPRFAWHRSLRIMPGFWVCLLVCAFVVAPAAALIQGLPATAGFTGTPSAWHFLTADWFLVIQQYDIGGVLNAAPHEPSFNGALWTLTFEAFCYLLVAALGLVGVLSRRRWVVLALAAALIVLTVLQENGVAVPMRDMTLRLTLMFALGALAHLYAERIPMNTWLGVLALALVLYSAAAFPHNYRLLGAVPMAYLVFWLATAGTRFVSLRIDLSYGIYIYHWPVIQLLAVDVAALVAGLVVRARRDLRDAAGRDRLLVPGGEAGADPQAQPVPGPGGCVADPVVAERDGGAGGPAAAAAGRRRPARRPGQRGRASIACWIRLIDTGYRVRIGCA